MKRWMAGAVAGLMLFVPAGVMADPAVDSLREQGILQGDEQGALKLSEPVTRAEFAKMLLGSLKLPEAKEAEFSDVRPADWYYGVMGAAAQNGILNGFEDGTVRPEAFVTYEQAVKMTAMAYGAANPGTGYPDGYIRAALERGYLDRMDALMDEAVTREDAVQLIYRAQQEREETKAIEDAGRLALEQMTQDSPESAAPMPSPTGIINMAGGSSPGGGGGGCPAEGVFAEPDIWYGNTEEYRQEAENVFQSPVTAPLSTFSLDVDTASYSNMRRFLMQGRKPAAGSIRTEELINYFDYSYPQPEGEDPLRVITQTGICPWNPAHQLAMIAVQGEDISEQERQPSNLVFLIDVSGSMYTANKLPLVQRSMALLLDTLDARDTISLVTYANGVRTVLDSVSAGEKDTVLKAVYGLRAGGGTAGGDGLKAAYDLAERNRKEGNNRIILCTDGDFNIGMSSTAELEDFIAAKRETGIYLSVLGFGMGNYKDNRMETLADKGNGNYAYIDNLREAKKVLADEMIKTLYTIAEDVKIQVEFNPEKVKEYRLVGYENRLLRAEDFEDDKKDAGEVGAGAVVTAFYELVPADGTAEDSGLRYQQSETVGSPELMYVNLRYKLPDGTESKLMEQGVFADQSPVDDNFCFAAAVAELGMLLNDSEYAGEADLDSVIALARAHLGEDPYGFRHEFVQLVDLYRYIQAQPDKSN